MTCCNRPLLRPSPGSPTGDCVRHLLGSLPRRPPHVELHGRDVDGAAPPDIRVRPRGLGSAVLPQLGRQPRPLQPHVHPFPGDVQAGDMPLTPRPPDGYPEWPADLAQYPECKTTQWTE